LLPWLPVEEVQGAKKNVFFAIWHSKRKGKGRGRGSGAEQSRSKEAFKKGVKRREEGKGSACVAAGK